VGLVAPFYRIFNLRENVGEFHSAWKVLTLYIFVHVQYAEVTILWYLIFCQCGILRSSLCVCIDYATAFFLLTTDLEVMVINLYQYFLQFAGSFNIKFSHQLSLQNNLEIL